MPETPRFQQLQYEFAAHLRDPGIHPAPGGIEDRRLKIYRELFYNNVAGFLENAFPVIRKLTADARWHAMVRDFYSRHKSHDPQFHRIPAEFLDYLASERDDAEDPPFLLELAHYEWVELDLSVSELELGPELAEPNGDLMAGVPVVSPLAQTLAYEFPVHRISPEFLPEHPGDAPSYLIVYRDRQDSMRFMEANAVTARLMELMQTGTQTGAALMRQLAEEMQHPQPDQLQAHGAQLLTELRSRDIVLGTARA